MQALCPAPKRYLQDLILRHGLQTGLDIGCGSDSPLTALRECGFRSTGIDVNSECIRKARAVDLHDEYIAGDFRDQAFDRQFDVVVMSHVIEHFNRDDGLRALQRIEAIARRLIYVETPHGFLEQAAYDLNPFQRHLSGWFPHDFEGRGYSVYGAGLKWMQRGVKQPTWLPAGIERGIARATQWLVFRRPRMSSAIAAIKYIDECGNVRKV